MTMNMKRHLLTLYTRSPLHVGSGTSVDVVDLPIMRERITGFPMIPATSLKGVLLQLAREKWGNPRSADVPDEAKILFGAIETEGEGDDRRQVSNAGCVQIMEGKLLAFPVRSLAGCFAWLTCPAALRRFARDAGKTVDVPEPQKDHVIAASELIVSGQNRVVLEEYALATQNSSPTNALSGTAATLASLTDDPLWRAKLSARLAIVHDENFQHFVTTCTEIATRIKISPGTRTVAGGALFNQENVPSETLFYTVLTVLPPRRIGVPDKFDVSAKLSDLLPTESPPIIQVGGDETTGHGLCATKREVL